MSELVNLAFTKHTEYNGVLIFETENHCIKTFLLLF